MLTKQQVIDWIKSHRFYYGYNWFDFTTLKQCAIELINDEDEGIFVIKYCHDNTSVACLGLSGSSLDYNMLRIIDENGNKHSLDYNGP